MATMLEKAKSVRVKAAHVAEPTVNPEELELFVALTEGAINRQQAAAVLGIKPSSVEGRRAVVFVKAVRTHLLRPEGMTASAPW